MKQFDPTTLEIYRALYTSVAEEMGVALRRTSFSPNIKERRDYSCAVFESFGRVIAQGDFRVMAGNDRAMEDLRRILEAREPLYRKADLCLDTSGDSVEQSFGKLRLALQASIP